MCKGGGIEIHCVIENNLEAMYILFQLKRFLCSTKLSLEVGKMQSAATQNNLLYET